MQQKEDVSAEAVTTVVECLKENGINLVSSLPSSQIHAVIHTIMEDEDFIHVPVANELEAIAIAAGAWMGGKTPAIILQNSGLVMALYALLDALYFYGGFPMLLIVEHKGDFYDNSGYWYYGYGIQLPKILDNFQIFYSVVRESKNLKTELTAAQNTAVASGKPAAILLSREAMKA
ncbi:MAG: thiamine pyrophosphate-binding protein [Desulfatiglandales bacterium]